MSRLCENHRRGSCGALIGRTIPYLVRAHARVASLYGALAQQKGFADFFCWEDFMYNTLKNKSVVWCYVLLVFL